MTKSICVFSSSRENPEFSGVAAELGQKLAETGTRIIYGGTNIGLMGVLAESARSAQGWITGIILEKFVSAGIMDTELDETCIVQTFGERKQMMFDRADAFIALPGGYGTLDEVTDMLVMSSIVGPRKPVILLNIHDFYKTFTQFLDSLEDAHFITREQAKLVHSVSSVDAALEQI